MEDEGGAVLADVGAVAHGTLGGVLVGEGGLDLVLEVGEEAVLVELGLPLELDGLAVGAGRAELARVERRGAVRVNTDSILELRKGVLVG